MLSSNNKVIISGNTVERYKYNKAFYFGERGTIQKKETNTEEDPKEREKRLELSRKKNAYRCQANFMRIVKANQNKHKALNGRNYHTFVTLTYAENQQHVPTAQRDFAKFIQRLNYEQLKAKKSELKYIGVIEFQKRGAIHFHVIFFNLGYIAKKKLDHTWKHGNTDIKAVRNIDKHSKYMAKYLTKTFLDPRLKNKKKFFCAKDMYRPQSIVNESKIKEVDSILSSYQAKDSYSYYSPFLGEVFVYVYEDIPEEHFGTLFFKDPFSIDYSDDW